MWSSVLSPRTNIDLSSLDASLLVHLELLSRGASSYFQFPIKPCYQQSVILSALVITEGYQTIDRIRDLLLY